MRPVTAPVVLVLCALMSPTASAQWQPGGVPVSSTASTQQWPASCSDGSGGAIIAWSDNRNGATADDIYVQRLDAAGVALWPAPGVAVCTAVGTQLDVRLVPDGAAGAILAWVDYRSGVADIYVQRVNSSGTPQWTADGVALCTAVGAQTEAEIISDGAAGAIVAWRDSRTSADSDIYVRRVSSAGVAQWTANGVALCTATALQHEPALVSDGASGAVVTWTDWRTAGSTNIFVRRITSLGTPQWTANGVALCTVIGAQSSPTIVTDGAGGAIVAWSDSRGNLDIYARRVNSLGTPLWTANGNAICSDPTIQRYPAAISDGAGGAIIAWRDNRGDVYSGDDLYAQRVNGLGTAQWTFNGAPVSTAYDGQSLPVIAPDGGGGAVIAWEDTRFYPGTQRDIFAQRLDAAGAAQWASDGVPIVQTGGEQMQYTIAPDNAGGAIVAWHDVPTGRVRAQLATPALAQPPVTITDIPIGSSPANVLVGDVDLVPHGNGVFGTRSFLPFSGNLVVLNTVTNAIETTIGLPSAAVQGIDFVQAPGSNRGVMMTVGHLLFFDDVTAGFLAPSATFTHTDTPVPDCDPFFVDSGGSLYCVVSYSGSVRVFSFPGGTTTDFYTVPRSSSALEAVDVQTDGTNLYVPNSTTLDFVTLATGVNYSTLTLAFPPKREVDLLYMANPDRAYWPLDGAILRLHPAGFVEATLPIAGTSVEGVDMATLQPPGGGPEFGAFPTTGFLHLVDIGAGTLIASCPTPGTVVRNFDPLVTAGNLTGSPLDGSVYWSVIGTTYAVDLSSPFAPAATLATPGGLIDGCDLAPSSDRTTAVLPHPGFVHVLDLETATVIGTITTPGDLIMDVDVIFPPPQLDVAIGSRVAQPYPGGILVVSGFTGLSDQCVLTTSTNLHILNLGALSLNNSIPLGGAVEGVDPVIAQGQTPTFDGDPRTARDVDQDFLCHEAHRLPYYCRPMIDPGVYTDWHDQMRFLWYRTWGIPMLSYMDPFTRVRATVLSDRQTLAFSDLHGNFINDLTLSSPIVGGPVANRSRSYFSVLQDNGEQIPIEMLPLSLTGTPPPAPPAPHPNGFQWPIIEDFRIGVSLGLTGDSEGLTIVDTKSGTVLQTLALPQPALFGPAVDYKNSVASVLLRGSRRAIVDLQPLEWGMPASMTVVDFYPGQSYYPIANTVYEPLNHAAMNLYFNPITSVYGFFVTHSRTGTLFWAHDDIGYPHPRIYNDPKTKTAKVPMLSGHEFVYNLAPLAWGGAPIYTDIGPVYPWRYVSGLAYYTHHQVTINGTHHVAIVDSRTQALVANFASVHAIEGPPVIDAQNQYARVRLESGYSLFIDLFELAKGNPNYYRYDFHGSNLVDEPIFDPIGGLDMTLDAFNNLTVWRSRTGVAVGTVNLGGAPVRPLVFDPHNRVLEITQAGGNLQQIDLSAVDGTIPVSLSLQPVNLGGQALAATDLVPPPPALVAGIQQSAIGPDGVVPLTAPPGTVEPNCYVAIGNLTNRSLEPVDVMADSAGGFVAYVLADSGDTVCVMTADVAGNPGADACFPITVTQSGAGHGAPPVPTALFAPSPNPSRGAVRVEFALSRPGRATLEVLDVTGRRVRRLLDADLPAGRHDVTWNGRNDRSVDVAAGIYFIRFAAEDRVFVERLVRVSAR